MYGDARRCGAKGRRKLGRRILGVLDCDLDENGDAIDWSRRHVGLLIHNIALQHPKFPTMR